MTQSINESNSKNFLSSPQFAYAKFSKLLRLIDIDEYLNSYKNSEEKTNNLFQSSLEAQKNVESSLDSAKQKMLETVGQIGMSVSVFYSPKFSHKTESSEIQKSIHKFVKEVKASKFFSIKPSARGNKGPTFLINYPKINSQTLFSPCVLKWTNWNEITCNRIYGIFSKTLFEHSPNPEEGFLVPQATSYDFKNQIHESIDGNRIQLDPVISKDLKSVLDELKSSIAPQGDYEDEEVMISERINGENLLDFALTKYKTLNLEQKKSFFQQLGQIAVIDLFMGNLDRLVQIFPDLDGEYQLDDRLETNLGNVMVKWSPDSKKNPLIFAIDNGIDPELIDDENSKMKYISFLEKEVFSNETAPEKISDHLCKTFTNSINSQTDELANDEQTRDKIMGDLSPFQKDLDQIARKAFSEGVRDMFEKFQKQYSSLSTEINSFDGLNFPKLVDSVKQRFNLIKINKFASIKKI